MIYPVNDLLVSIGALAIGFKQAEDCISNYKETFTTEQGHRFKLMLKMSMLKQRSNLPQNNYI